MAGYAGTLLAGRYRLEHQLGSGAMGVVWLATDERLQRQVAVKQLIAQHGLDEVKRDEASQRAMREGRIAGRLHHPNAVAVHDVTEHDGLPVLVMEYVRSRSLQDVVVERGPLPPGEVVGIGVQAATGLAAAHETGITHRDVKPGNVLLGEDGTVKITDFGLSHAVGDVAVTQSGLLNGTPAYLAPEIARGEQPTAASDVFSLGATLYAAVEARAPFGEDSDNSLAVLHEAASGDFRPPQSAGPLAPLLDRMMRSDPDQRWDSRRVRDALNALANGQPVPELGAPDDHTQPMPAAVPPVNNGTQVDTAPAAQPGSATTPHRRRRRRKLPAVAAAAVTAVLAAGVLLSQLGSGAEPAPPPPKRVATPAELERVVSDYYAMLPKHSTNAWSHLSPRMQSSGPDDYRNFWNTVSRVVVFSPPRTSGANTVRVGVELDLPDGTKMREFHQLGLVSTNTADLIDTDAVLHTDFVAPPPAPAPPQSNDGRHGGEDQKGSGKEENGKGHGKKGDKGKKGGDG